MKNLKLFSTLVAVTLSLFVIAQITLGPPEINALCPAEDGLKVKFLPDPYNCANYYECADGLAYQKECPPGLLFDDLLNACSWSSDVDCGNRPRPGGYGDYTGEGSSHVICYYESKVKVGFSYYDCGSCTKVYDEEAKGKPSKCWR